MRIECVPRK